MDGIIVLKLSLLRKKMRRTIDIPKLITKKIIELTPDIPIISEESSLNKSNDNLG